MKTRFISFSFLLSVTLSLSSQVPTKGLVLYLPLNGSAKDSTSFANNGTNYGATPVTDRFGRANKAMYFDGTSRIEVPSSSSLNLVNNKTLSCWLYIPSTVSLNLYPTLISKPEPLYSATYNLQLNETSGYTSDLRYKFDYYFASSYSHYQVYSKQLYTNYKDKWLHIVASYDSLSGYSKIYFNGMISDSIYIGKKTANSSTTPLYIGCGGQFTSSNGYKTCFTGKMDDVRLYNRAITKDEVYQLYMEGQCTNSIKSDTTTYSVSTESFKSISPKFQFLKTDTLKTKVGGCDSIINRYAKFEYNPNGCTTTNSISVTDTLVIKLTLSEIKTTNNTNTIKIYPNPAKDQVNIDFGDFTKMPGYLMLIRNAVGSAVFFSTISQNLSTVDIKSWAPGIYAVQIFNSSSILVDTRKIIIK
jgi:Pentaxin family.